MQVLINIDVEDLEEAIAFYTTAFELRVARRLFDGSVAELEGAPSPICLMAKAAGTAPAPGIAARRDYRRHWTPVHLDLAVADLTAAVRRAVAAGARLEGNLQHFDWGSQATLSDPFGHGFCLLQFSKAGYDAVTCR